MENAHMKLLESVTHMLEANFSPPAKASPQDKTRDKVVEYLTNNPDGNPALAQALLQLIQSQTKSEIDIPDNLRPAAQQFAREKESTGKPQPDA